MLADEAVKTININQGHYQQIRVGDTKLHSQVAWQLHTNSLI
jgi:hypothetical protein